jgi:hypothetical protein
MPGEGGLQGGLGAFVNVCPRCRQVSPTLLRPRPDVVLCPSCWDLLLLIAAGGADDVDAR